MRNTTLVMLGVVALAFAACTNDYDAFDVVGTAGSSTAGQGGGTAGTDGGTGGAAGKAGADAGTGGTAGQGGGVAGQGGGVAGQGGGVAGQGGGTAGQGGAATCQPDEKLCNSTCVKKNDWHYGCVDSTCDACVVAHGTPVCQVDACAVSACDQGWDNCSGGATDGCETDLQSSAANCGACDFACSQQHTTAAPTCAQGKCVPVCETGWADCEQPTQSDDGCETDLESSATNCGACGNDCTIIGGTPGFACVSGACGCGSTDSCKEASNVPNASCNTGTGICTCGGNQCKANETCVKIGGSSGCSCMGKQPCMFGDVCCPSKNGCSQTCP